MAIIHHGRNELQKKINEETERYIEECLQEEKRSFDRHQKWMKENYERGKSNYAQEVKEFRRFIPLRVLLLLLSVALLALLVLCPEIIQTVRSGIVSVLDKLDHLLEAALDALEPREAYSLTDFLILLLDLVLILLFLLVGILLWLLQVLSGVLALLICVVIPVGIAAFVIYRLKNPPKFADSYFDHELDKVFDEAAEREKLMKQPPPDTVQQLQAGLDGEELALTMLCVLKNDCHIYTNLRIPYDGKESETDIIVVAPHTVTIVEVKNYKRALTGDWSDEHLLKAKHDDTDDSDEVYNPVKQVATHVYRLSHYLREHGVNARVNRCVLFVGEGSIDVTDIHNATIHCPVFQYDLNALYAYVQTPQKDTEGHMVVKLLDELIKQQKRT